MKSLFISTYNELITIGLLDNGKLIKTLENVSERSHSTYLVPLIEEILKEEKLDTKDLNEIIVVNGPGSFTGVRLGVTVAKTLAHTLNIPIKTITSIEALGVSDKIKELKIIIIKDSKGVYFGIFKNNKLVEDMQYISDNDFTLFLANHQEYHKASMVTDSSLDIEAIYEYLKEKKSINPHEVNPVYIKMIEALK